MKYIYCHMKGQWGSALQKKIETDLKETESTNKQHFSLFTQVTTAFLVKVIRTVSLSLLQFHLTQECWRCSELTRFRSQGDLEGFLILHTNRLAKTSHFQLWSGRQGYVQEANSFCPSPQMPHVTSTDGTSCKEQVKTLCSTQPKTWLSPACHVIASMWKQNQRSAHIH